MPVINAQIAGDLDDVCSSSVGFYAHNYDCCFVGHSVTFHLLSAGLRFRSLAIPKGATIVSANLSVYAQYSMFWTNALTARVYAEAADDPGAWESGTHEPHSATTTTAYATWSPESWTDNQWHDSPDVSSVISEIVNREGWASGNDMCFIWKTTLSEDFSEDSFAGFTDYDGATSNCAKLTLEYVTAKPYYYFAQQ